MMEESELEETLLEAYRATHYEVFPPAALTLRVGRRCDGLAALMEQHGVGAAAYVTACNPRSQALPAAENEARCAALLAELVAEGYTCLAGEGRHPDGGWTPEPSLLVLGLEREAALALGRRWEQNAVLWAGPDAAPELVLLR